MKKTFVIAVAVALAACSKEDDRQHVQYSPQPQQQPQTAPVVVQSAPAQGGHNGTDMLMAGAIGYMLGGGGGFRSPATTPPSTVVNKTIINKTYVQAAPTPAAKPTYTAPRPATSYSYRPSSRRR